MNEQAGFDYLVVSRGQWDADLPPATLQRAIDDFYAWHAELAGAGKVRPGQRLAPEVRRVSQAAITDGPFAEAKEVIGGYWFVTAASLDEAAKLMSASPCLACGLWYEIRPIDPERCSAAATTTETPIRR
ncbi:MAG: YciI family protein [Solimonas sp.]